jgi:mono/diheme cytochrome c family protein
VKDDMKKTLCVLIVAIAGLGGCEQAYSPALRYQVRKDPVVMVPGGQLADERIDPDRPGQLPLLTVSGIFDPRNPLFAKREDIENKEKLRDPTTMPAADRQKLESTLEELFGTPAHPKVRNYDDATKKVVDLTPEAQQTLKLDAATLEKGSGLYRIHCVHCHGVPGDGRGPTAQWVNPHPRDFRQGLFKFQSVDQTKQGMAGSPPRRADLLHTLEYGLEGSAMPAFTLLTNAERETLVSYVIHLSLRGHAEYETIRGAFDRDNKTNTLAVRPTEEGPPEDLAAYLGFMQARNVGRWLESQKPANAIHVPPYPYDIGNIEELRKSAERGQQMFIGKANPDAGADLQKWVKAANCVSCHTTYGRQSTFRWDDWATLAKPNNLTVGVYRGGRRPIDFYYRIHSGINGSGMANFGSSLPPQAIWDLVNFVRTLPYPAMRPELALNIQ